MYGVTAAGLEISTQNSTEYRRSRLALQLVLLQVQRSGSVSVDVWPVGPTCRKPKRLAYRMRQLHYAGCLFKGYGFELGPPVTNPKLLQIQESREYSYLATVLSLQTRSAHEYCDK